MGDTDTRHDEFYGHGADQIRYDRMRVTQRGPRSIDDELAAKRKEKKPPLALVPGSAVEGIASVVWFGVQKHGRDDWRKGFPWTERLSSALRHITAFVEGDDWDVESGLCHLDHAMCQLAMVREYMVTHPECDDRYATVAREDERDQRLREMLESEM